MTLWLGIPRMFRLEVFGVYDFFGVYVFLCFVGFRVYANDLVLQSTQMIVCFLGVYGFLSVL